MIARLLVVALFSVAFAQVGDIRPQEGEGYAPSDDLKKLIQETGKKVAQTSTRINNTLEEYTNIVADRLHSLTWECTKQKNTLEQAIINAVITGMKKDKDLKSFQCISNKALEPFVKLDNMENRIPTDTDEKIHKALESVTAFKRIMRGFDAYLEDLFNTKSEELKKAKTIFAKRKVVRSAKERTTVLESLLEKLDKQTTDNKFKFLEEYIKYAFETANTLVKIQKDGAEAIKKCVA